MPRRPSSPPFEGGSATRCLPTSSWPRGRSSRCRASPGPFRTAVKRTAVEHRTGGCAPERDHLVRAERARLLGRIDTWADTVAWELVTACAHRVVREAAAALRRDGHGDAAAGLVRATDLAELQRGAASAAGHPRPAGRLAGHVADICLYARDAGVAAHAAGIAAKMSAYALAGEARDAAGYDEWLAQERAWQAAWLVDRLGL